MTTTRPRHPDDLQRPGTAPGRDAGRRRPARAGPRRRCDRRAGEHRARHRPVRDAGDPAAGEQRAGRRRGRARRALRARVARRRGVRRIVEYDPAARTYALCPEVRPFVTGPGADNLARTMRLVTLMGQVTPKVIECFRHGGGLTYADYPGFHDLPGRRQRGGQRRRPGRHDHPPDRSRASGSPTASTCSTSAAARGTRSTCSARAFPRSRFTGVDFSTEAVAAARAEADAWGLRNVELRGAGRGGPAGRRVRPRHRLRRHPRPGPAGDGAGCRATGAAPGRHASSWSTSTRRATSRTTSTCRGRSFLYAASTLHCMAVSLGQGGDGPGHRVGRADWRSGCCATPASARSSLHDLEDDPFNAYFVART